MKQPYVKKFPQTAFIMMANHLNHLIDMGVQLSVDETYKMCQTHTLIPWLEKNTDMSLWDNDSKIIMSEEFDAMASCYVAEDFGVKHNGICFILAMALSFILNPPSRTVEDCI